VTGLKARAVLNVFLAGSILALVVFPEAAMVQETKPVAPGRIAPPPAPAPVRRTGPEVRPTTTIVFENVIERSGITYVLKNSVSPSRYYYETMIGGAAVFDFNNDGFLDIFFPNGGTIPGLEKADPSYYNRLYRNDGDGTFTDVTDQAGVRGLGYSMGVATGDYDNDGFVDLYVCGVNHNQLLHNNGDGTFSDVTAKAGVPGIHPKFGKTWAITAGWFDYDNDGRLDLFFTTVYGIASFGKKNYPVLYRQESPFVFSDATASAGLAQLSPTSQAAWADFNNDGHLDLVTGGKVLVHRGTANHWLKVRLEGDGRIVNRSAIGTQVRLRLGDQTLTRQVEAGTGEGNQNDLTLHFGLGSHGTPVPLEIFWPNASRQVVGNVLPDRTISIRFGKSP